MQPGGLVVSRRGAIEKLTAVSLRNQCLELGAGASQAPLTAHVPDQSRAFAGDGDK